MTKTVAAYAAGKRPLDDWRRREHLPSGHRLYSSPGWVRYFRGLGKPSDWSFVDDPDRESRPELPSRFHILQLDTEPESDRYMSLTARLRRYWDIFYAFEDIVAGRFTPTRYPPFVGTPQLPPLRRGPCGRWFLVPGPPPEWHGPSVEWRERTSAIWATLPANDSDIFPRPAATETPKLGHLADQLAPLLKWAGARMPLSLDGTNWLQADNDTYSDGDDAPLKPASNRERRMRPGSSDAELKSYIAKAGPVSVWKHARDGGGGGWELVPTDADFGTVTYQRYQDVKPKTHRTIIRAGKLRLGSGGTESGGVVVEGGTILHQPDKFGELLGPEPDAAEKKRRLSFWHRLMSFDASNTSCRLMEPIRHKKAGRMRRKVLMTQAEQIATLADPRVPKPAVTYCRPGLPCGAEDIGTQFVGGHITSTKGSQPPPTWQDVSDELSRQAEFDQWFAALPEDQRKALDLACIAANLREIGEAFGKTRKTAERYGRTILIKANDNLRKVMAA